MARSGRVATFVRAYLHAVDDGSQAYRGLRRGIGRAILFGLGLFVAADIVRTVAVDPTLQSVLVLALVVMIRTFRNWSIEVEVNGRWPWQGATAATPPGVSR